MSSGIPHHAADRIKKERIRDSGTLETPRKAVETPKRVPISTPRRPPAGRLGMVKTEPPTPIPKGMTKEFMENRARRKARHAERLAKEPPVSLIPGGVNPFDTEDVVKNVGKMFDALHKVCPAARASAPWDRTPRKIRFREEEVKMEEEMATMAIDENTVEVKVEEEYEEEEYMEEEEQNATIMNDED